MGYVLSSMVEVSINKMALVNTVRVNDCSAELAIIASIGKINFLSPVMFPGYARFHFRWLVRVTLVVVFGFLHQYFGR